MLTRYRRTGLSTALGMVVAMTGTASAQTILDLARAGDPSIVDKEFRHLAPPSAFPLDAFTFAWGVSVNGVHAAGESRAACPDLGGDNGFLLCTRAAVWTPAFGTSPAEDEPFILPTGLGIPTGSLNYYSQARAIDADGDTVVGREEYRDDEEDFQFRALAWTRSGPTWSDSTTDVTVLAPVDDKRGAGARGVSDNGQFAVGWSAELFEDGGFQFQDVEASLWRRTAGPNNWEPGEGLGYLNGDNVSVANGVALGDGGPVAVGWSASYRDSLVNLDFVLRGSGEPDMVFVSSLNWFPKPFVWTSGNMQPLQMLSDGERGDATAISADAKTIVGWSQLGSVPFGEDSAEAVRWRHQGGTTWSGPQGLGLFELPDSVNDVLPVFFRRTRLGSVALGVSEKGEAIVGYQSFGYSESGSAAPLFSLALIWTEALGTAHYLGDVLGEAGVDIGKWVLFSATGVRANEDFFVVVGDGCLDGESVDCFPSQPGYIARLGREPHSPSGITTPEEQIESFGEISAAAMAVGSSVGTTLAGLNDTAENHRCIRPEDGPVGNWCFFTFGTANLFSGDGELDGNQFTGEVGIAHYFTPVTSIAASVGGGVVDSDLYLGGNYRASEVHVGGYVAHIPDQGFRAFFGGVWGDLTDIDLTRGYLNGIGLARSFGDTDGEAWGLLGRLGYGFQASPATFVTPFVEVSFTEASFAGYTETGGPFPTTFQGIDTNTTIGRLGVLHEQDLSATLRVYLQAAWAHVLDSETPIVRGAVLDIFELTAHGHGGIDDWAEFMAGARSQVSERGVLSVTGRIATEFDDFFSLGGRLGYSHIF